MRRRASRCGNSPGSPVRAETAPFRVSLPEVVLALDVVAVAVDRLGLGGERPPEGLLDRAKHGLEHHMPVVGREPLRPLERPHVVPELLGVFGQVGQGPGQAG